jgi:hypothetical protein
MTFLKKIKVIIEACCGKLDSLEDRMSKLQEKQEQMENDQKDQIMLLEEILFTVSQSNDNSENKEITNTLYDEKTIQTKRRFSVN